MSNEEGGQVSLIPTLNLTHTKEAESRLEEVKTVNPITFADLSYCLNEAWRELKRTHADLNFRIAKAEHKRDQAKAKAMIDDYQKFLKESGIRDTAEIKSAYLTKNAEISDLTEQIDTMEAMLALVDSKIKLMERHCKNMDTQIQIILKSGMDYKLYPTT